MVNQLTPYLAILGAFLTAANPVVHQILLPAARYLQVRAALTTTTDDDKLAAWAVRVLEVAGSILETVARCTPHMSVVGKK